MLFRSIPQSGAATERAKPALDTPVSTDKINPAPLPVDAASPDFLITDPAGYSRSLADFKGRILVVGIWSPENARGIATLENVYQALSVDTNLRIVGVSMARQAKPAGTTFPLAYNQGSKLLGLKPEQFAVVDGNGGIRLKGSLNDETGKVLDSIRSAVEKLH